MILNKIDLLPYVHFDVAKATANVLSINPRIKVMCLSARTGAGLGAWLRAESSAAKSAILR